MADTSGEYNLLNTIDSPDDMKSLDTGTITTAKL